MSAGERQPLVLSVAEAAPLLGVDERTFHRHLNAGTWPFPQLVMKVGGRLKVSRYQLERFARGELTEAAS